MRFFVNFSVLLFVLLYLPAGFCSETAELIPREILFGNPLNAAPELSPDGKKLAYLAPSKGVLNVWVRTLGKEDDRPVTDERFRGIRRYFWSETNNSIFYLQDKDGNENWHLYSLDLKTGQSRDLTPFDGVKARVSEYNKYHPGEMLVALNKRDRKVYDLYYLDLASGDLTLIEKNPGNISYFLTDDELKAWGAVRAGDKGSYDLVLKKEQDHSWQTFITWEHEDWANSGPVVRTRDGSCLYLRDSRGTDTNRLLKIKLSTGQSEIIAQDPDFDLGRTLIHPDTYEVQAVTVHKERKHWVVLDKSIEDDLDFLKNLDRGDLFISSRDNADKQWVVGFNKDNGPIPFYLFERSTKKTEFLFFNRPELARYKLTETEPVSFSARDGLILQAYLTCPAGKGKKGLPAVLLVHGGPWSRDTWGYDPEVQWLADRGYAVLQVNFRGSTGFGKKFLNAGNKEWGGKMQNDLTDAAKWMISSGTADPERIAVFGASYGGYAALAGAAFTPDLFCCAVDVVGPGNLISFINSIPPYWSTFLSSLYQRVGNPETEEEFLRERSPLFSVDKIKIPLLIAQGANDPRVNRAESEQIVAALKEKGLKYQYLLFTDEGHGFARPENRLKFYAAAEKFLAEHLGGRYQPPAPEVKSKK